MDKPLCEGEKSFLVNIWDELFLLNMEGKTLATLPNILNNLAWRVSITALENQGIYAVNH